MHLRRRDTPCLVAEGRVLRFGTGAIRGACCRTPKASCQLDGLITATPMGPYGLLTGGILWLIGVRPAPGPAGVGEVFR